jgi:hypothetical protein
MKKLMSILFLILLFLIFSTACFVKYISTDKTLEESIKQTEERISKDSKLKEYDDLCKSIKIPTGYELKGRSVGIKGKRVNYFYKSSSGDVINHDSLRSFYTVYLKDEGWELVSDGGFVSKWTEFQKDGKYLMISTAPDAGMDWGKTYGLSCDESAYK